MKIPYNLSFKVHLFRVTFCVYVIAVIWVYFHEKLFIQKNPPKNSCFNKKGLWCGCFLDNFSKFWLPLVRKCLGTAASGFWSCMRKQSSHIFYLIFSQILEKSFCCERKLGSNPLVLSPSSPDQFAMLQKMFHRLDLHLV